MSAVVVNFFGGPGAGKSTLASGVFHKLKQRGDINCEFVHEFAKELTWEGRAGALSNQTWLLGSQFELLRRCMDQVDVIITDTSLLCSTIYCHNYDLPYAKEIETLALAMFNSMNNLTFLIERTKPYNPVGRYQNEAEAKKVDVQVQSMLTSCGATYAIIPGNDLGVEMALVDIDKYLAGDWPFPGHSKKANE